MTSIDLYDELTKVAHLNNKGLNRSELASEAQSQRSESDSRID